MSESACSEYQIQQWSVIYQREQKLQVFVEKSSYIWLFLRQKKSNNHLSIIINNPFIKYLARNFSMPALRKHFGCHKSIFNIDENQITSGCIYCVKTKYFLRYRSKWQFIFFSRNLNTLWIFTLSKSSMGKFLSGIHYIMFIMPLFFFEIRMFSSLVAKLYKSLYTQKSSLLKPRDWPLLIMAVLT